MKILATCNDTFIVLESMFSTFIDQCQQTKYLKTKKLHIKFDCLIEGAHKRKKS